MLPHQPCGPRRTRKRLGLSIEEMAAFLRLMDAQSVRRYEDRSRDISGPIQLAIAYRLKFGPLP